MPPIDHQGRALSALCVSIHDVAPATWPACLQLLEAVRAVADIPLTWLVVPRFHDVGVRSGELERTLAKLAGQGHELALHGYTHLDQHLGHGAPAPGLAGRFVRQVVTVGEGEFSAVGANEARRRIELGLGWFRQRGWRAAGFVAPAWLLSDGTWEALREYPFSYTTSYRRFYVLPGKLSLRSPALVYAARNQAGRILSPPAVSVLAATLRRRPLVRLALHPRDAAHPALLRHAQRLIASLLDGREAMTKAAVAERCGSGITSTVPSIRPCPNDAVRSQRNTTGGRSVQHPLWR